MTALEKFREGYPNADLESTVFWCCPEDFGFVLEGEKPCEPMDKIQEERCRRCWNREVRE